MTRSTRNLRILPLSVIVSLAVLSAFLLFKTTPDSYGLTKQQTYHIYGKEYIENGVCYDIFTDTTIDPTTGKKSYNHAEVVLFQNHAVIPSYVVVDNCRYPVTIIRRGANGIQNSNDDYKTWVTLPTSLKTCSLISDLDYYYNSKIYGKIHWFKLQWIKNVNVANLDSFFLMNSFYNTFPDSLERYNWYINENAGFVAPTFQYNPVWKLYLNLKQVHDIVLPEKADLNKINIANCAGINSLIIPASDTARKEPVKWRGTQMSAIGTVRFKADSGYDLTQFFIHADTVVLPKAMTVFNGLGNNSYMYNFQYQFQQGLGRMKFPIAIWPYNLEIINSTFGLDSVILEELPKTVKRVKGKFTVNSCKTDNTVIVPNNIRELDTCSFYRFNRNGGYDTRGMNIVIEEDEEPLFITGEIAFDAFVERLEIRRPLIVSNAAISDIFTKLDLIDYLFFGRRIEIIPEAVCRFGDISGNTPYQGPEYMECEGLTPPNFETENPHILNWCAYTTLIINKQAEEAYRNHPVWGKFLKIETSGAGHVVADKEVVSEKWYTVEGLPLSGPEPGKTNIRVTTYSDGTTSSAKIAVPE